MGARLRDFTDRCHGRLKHATARFLDYRHPGFPWFSWLMLLASLGVFLAFGLHHLGKFETADEHLWYKHTSGRITKYWKAIEEERWKDTRINDKPGVTTALVAGSLGYRRDNLNGSAWDEYIDPQNIPPSKYEERIFFYRLPILLVNSLLVLVIVFAVWKFTRDDLLAVLTGIFLFLSPILLGISQIVNPDSTVWSFGFASFMIYLVFLKTGKFRYLLAAAPLLGFALLSKYSTSIIYFIAFAATLVTPFYEVSTFPNRKTFSRYFLKILIGFPLLILGSLATYAYFMPAARLDHTLLYRGTIGFRHSKDVTHIVEIIKYIYGIALIETLLLQSRLFYLAATKLSFLRRLLTPLGALLLLVLLGTVWYNWSIGANALHLPVVPFDAGSSSAFRSLSEFHRLLYEVKPLVFTLPLFTLAAAAFALSAGGFLPKPRSRFLLVFLLALYVLAYYAAALSQKILVHVRYSILLYPALSLLAALGVALLLDRLRTRLFRTVAVFLVFLAALLPLIGSRPYYFNFTNNSLPRADSVVGAWGYGGYEAAQYINALSEPPTKRVWSDYFGVCPFLEGKCVEGSLIKWHKGSFNNIDYVVVTRRGLMRNEGPWEKLNQSGLRGSEPIWSLDIGGRPDNFIRIYKLHHRTESTTKESAVPKPTP